MNTSDFDILSAGSFLLVRQELNIWSEYEVSDWYLHEERKKQQTKRTADYLTMRQKRKWENIRLIWRRMMKDVILMLDWMILDIKECKNRRNVQWIETSNRTFLSKKCVTVLIIIRRRKWRLQTRTFSFILLKTYLFFIWRRIRSAYKHFWLSLWLCLL